MCGIRCMMELQDCVRSLISPVLLRKGRRKKAEKEMEVSSMKKYQVSVKCTLPAWRAVKVEPASSFTMSEQNATVSKKPNITGTVNQGTTTWKKAAVNASKWTVQQGTVSVPKITAGKWKGTINFTVGIIETPEA